ncbi:hypothetical protein TTHERM_00581440 (macronuclear) [Tetrahymena thermophila SB210]|uniref:Uncharacterized protein n=1 Tax=Tetrahymena thermophila (strain SB210) TaxID=312017 RepID=Q23QD9_TETTS|nr:hypothetical protein TTHERM_00581440 [Tetrahymena thermophila SB210]EAR98645.2 hypothetical protein TTHERM_00581440 [Tetrahymena thermophila SB210]|eukprot:XP_001018890.2 hypothetical protein TTHERM_00581440 [Tetrahymena thermophila SB210]
MILDQENLVRLFGKRNEKIKMTGLSIKQYITNSVIKTEVIQKFEFEESIIVIFKDNPYRKKFKIHLGEKFIKSRLEERAIFAKQENVVISKDKFFMKYQDYKMIELEKIPEPKGENQEITVSFTEIGSVMPKFSCMYFNMIKIFSNEIIEDLQSYNLNIYLNMSSQIDFIKVYSKADTKITFYNHKKSASIVQINLKTMEECLLYYRHQNINIPQISFGKEKDRQTIIMIDYLPPFNPEKDYRQCIKNNPEVNSLENQKDSDHSMESVEFCIVMDTSSRNGQRKYDCNQMQFLLTQTLQKIQNTILQKNNNNNSSESNNEVQNNKNKTKQVNYINFSFLDECGWNQQYFKMKENTIEELSIIKNEIMPKIEWKNEESDFISFLDNFTIVQNSMNIPKVLFLITQCQWISFDESVEHLSQLRKQINQNQPQIQIGQNNLSDSKTATDDQIQKKQANNPMNNILDVFILYHGEDSYAQEQLKKAVSSQRFFTKNNIDTPEFPQQDLFYLKKHSDFYLEANRENIEFSTIPLQVKQSEQKSKIQVKYNQIFQQFIFLELGTSALKGNLNYFDGRTRQICQIPIEFSKNKKKDKADSFLESDDIAMIGLIKLFQSDELIEQRELMKNMSIRNHIHSPITQEVFCIYDSSNENYSSDASVKEISFNPSQLQTLNQNNHSISSRMPSVIKYEAPKADLFKPLTTQTNSQSYTLNQIELKSKQIISELIHKKLEREKKLNEKNKKYLDFNLSAEQYKTLAMKKVKTIVDTQELSGCWKYNESLLFLLKYSKEDFFTLKRRISHRSEPHIDSLIMTSIILIELKMRFSEYFKYWESCQIKSTNWIDENFPNQIYIKAFRIARELHDSKANKKS